MFDEDAECDRLEGGKVSRVRLEVVVDEDGEEEWDKQTRRRLCLWRGGRAGGRARSTSHARWAIAIGVGRLENQAKAQLTAEHRHEH
jgi:hypothetical protein